MRLHLLVALLTIPLLALQIQPTTITIDEPAGETYEQVFTIINNEPKPTTITIITDKHSTYLEDTATLTKRTFTLKPQETTNIQLRGTKPVLGPETHHLRYHLQENGETRETIDIQLPGEGTPTLSPRISVAAQDIATNEPVSAEITLYNFGNIITYYNLTLRIQENEETLGTIKYPEAVQVLPGEEETLTLIYTDKLEPGEYTAKITGIINEEETRTAETTIKVLLAEQAYEITPGEDLIITIKRYNDIPLVEYELKQEGNILLQETTYANSNELTIPTNNLPTGTYDLTFTVTHAQGTDTNRVQLLIQEEKTIPLEWLAALLGAGILFLIFRPTTRLHIRIYLLQRKLTQKEKELNLLIEEAHRIR